MEIYAQNMKIVDKDELEALIELLTIKEKLPY